MSTSFSQNSVITHVMVCWASAESSSSIRDNWRGFRKQSLQTKLDYFADVLIIGFLLMSKNWWNLCRHVGGYFSTKNPTSEILLNISEKPKTRVDKRSLDKFASIFALTTTDLPNVWFNTWHFENFKSEDHRCRQSAGLIGRQVP